MYYVAGGLYSVKKSGVFLRDIKEFQLVRPSGNLPCYITKSSKGLALTRHHASLYSIEETNDGYMLKRVRHDMLDSPATKFIKRYTKLWSYLNSSIQYAEANNKFYE